MHILEAYRLEECYSPDKASSEALLGATDAPELADGLRLDEED